MVDPPGANVYHRHDYGGNQTAASFDHNLHHIPFEPGFSFASSHVLHNPVDTVTNVNGVAKTLVQDISQGTQILKESAKTTQTSGVHQALNTYSEGTHVKYTEYEGEQRNISTGGHCTEKSKMTEADIRRIHANVGVTLSESEQVQHQEGGISRQNEALDVTVLAGGENIIRQSGTGEFLQFKSVRETAESSMEQVAQTSISTSTENITPSHRRRPGWRMET